jgi:beta-phosphoglucomutase-like phosphatase (HAD superfamily)
MKPFPVGGAIFDLDGVLVDTACDHFEAWQQMARSLGFELSAAQGERLKGVGRPEALDHSAVHRARVGQRKPPCAACGREEYPVPETHRRTRPGKALARRPRGAR